MIIAWAESAKADRHRIWMFLAHRSVAHADRVDVRLEERISSLASLPHQGRRVTALRRDLSIPDIQLVVRYRVDEDAVRILQVWSTRENREEP